MKNRKKYLRWILFAAVLLLMTGCSGHLDKEDAPSEVKEEKLQIGMSFDSFVVERWLRDRDFLN